MNTSLTIHARCFLHRVRLTVSILMYVLCHVMINAKDMLSIMPCLKNVCEKFIG